MSDYSKLVEALRCKRDDCEGCDLAFFDKDEGWMCQYAAKDDDAAAAIEELQAQLPKRGEWKPFDLTYGRSIYSCSVCEQATEVPVCMEKPMYAYCPNCGSQMRGEVNERD